jgi:hypothetical protein
MRRASSKSFSSRGIYDASLTGLDFFRASTSSRGIRMVFPTWYALGKRPWLNQDAAVAGLTPRSLAALLALIGFSLSLIYLVIPKCFDNSKYTKTWMFCQC